MLVEFAAGSAVITGDAQDNSVAISAVDGGIRVLGLDGTTINGSAAPFVLVAGSTTLDADLLVRLGDGNDAFVIVPGVTINGHATIEGGVGSDELGLDSVQIAGSLTVRMGSGDDGLNLENSSVAGNVRIQNDSGGLVVNMSGGSVGGQFIVYSSAGDVDVVLESVAASRNTLVKALRGTANVIIQSSQFDGLLSVMTGSGDDFVFVNPTTVEGTARFKLGAGVDTLVLEGANEFNGNALIIGGDGGDAVRLANANRFSLPPRQIGIEVHSVLQSFIELRMNDPDTGALTRAAQLAESVINLLAPPLVIDTSANTTIQSQGTLLTNASVFEISGVTDPDAVITIDHDGDGVFDDGIAVAGSDGSFTIDVSLLAGPNPIGIRSTSAITGGARTQHVDVHRAEGTVVRLETALGFFDIELFDAAAPVTVENFLDYLDRYGDSSFVHRSMDGFVIQGGGFLVGGNGQVEIDDVPTDAPIPSEFNPANSNVRGTLSTALFGTNVNSATSQWFINTVDNLFLDNVPHTVFGRVVGTGMDVVDAINDTPTFNLNGVFPETALSTVPLVDYTPFTRDLTGTVTVQPGSVVVTGTGTQFTAELQAAQSQAPGSAIRIGTQEFTVSAILSNTQLTLNRAHPTGATNATAQLNDVPDAESFITFDAITPILNHRVPPPLVIDVSANTTVQSNGTLVTRDGTFQISGVTEAGAIVEIDRDGDGEFDDGTVVAGNDGSFTIDVGLLAGDNPVRVRSTSSATDGRTTQQIDVYLAEGTLVRLDTSLGSFDIELLDIDAPLTVANFLGYLDRYDGSIIHRSNAGFVIQGGGFILDANGAVQLDPVPTDSPIPTEFNPDNSNLRGTLSTALLDGDVNSATSQWFINTANNPGLDGVPHTVFGRVIGAGMDVVDAINQTQAFNLNGVFPQSALATVPLVDYTPFTRDLTGTVTVQPGSVVVNGTGTSFLTDLQGAQGGAPGSAIRIGNQVFTVSVVISDTQLTLSVAHPTGATDVTAQANDIPDEASFIVFSEIAELLLL
ncbi:MAG TPA: peptidylprolyl isomerase [Planctomycetaceae bacterium]|nr:peptidylprolyl isomerase [Planctomycetaceae bacterium]